MKFAKPPVLLAALLLCWGSAGAIAQEQDFFRGEELSSLQRNRAYPHVDRGLREYGKKQYRAAAESFARALEIAPASARIRVALARAYAADGHFDEAERELQPLAAKDPEAAETLFHLRATRLESSPPVPKDAVVGWLRECTPAWCIRYATLAATYLANHGQAAAARAILADYRSRGLGGEPRAALVLEAAVAENLKDWTGARNAWQAAAGIRPLTAAENSRYGMALLGCGDFDAVRALLDTGFESTPEGQRLAREFVQRAIAAKRPKAALDELARLDARGGLTPAERVQRLRLLLATGQTAEAERLLTRLDRARCSADRPGQCGGALPAGLEEREWLAAAGQLGRTDILERTSPASEAGKQQRLHLLADQYQRRGQYSQLISLLQPVPPDRPLALSLALAYQRSGETLSAAAQLEQSFHRWRQWSDLEQASYLLVTAGATDRARQLLLSNLPFPEGKQGSTLVQRLLETYQAAPEKISQADLETLGRQKLTGAQAGMLADLWRRQGRCDRSIALLENREPEVQGLLALADCHRSTRPDLAAHYLELAQPHAPELAARSLAYLQTEAGNPKAAVARWQSLPPQSLERRDRLVAAAAAIEAGELILARRWWMEAQLPPDAEWHRVGGRLEEKAGHPQEALQHWTQAMQLAPDGNSAYAMGRLLSAEGRRDEALSSYREAFRLAPEEEEYRLSLAFALVEKEPAAAAELLDNSRRQGAQRFPIDEQLSYLRIRLGDNEAARRHLAAAVDAADDYLAQSPADEAAERSFALRRSREGLDRRWSFGFNTWTATSGVPGELVAGRPLPGGAPRHYAEANAEVRLGDEPMDNYRFLALTTRASVQGTKHDPYLEGQGLFGLGLRWKPLSNWNLYLSGEEQLPLNGNGKSEFMVRTTASLLDQNAYRADWHPSGRGWFQQDVYLDAAKWVGSDRYDALARYTFGYNHKLDISAASTLSPYAFAQAEKRSDGSDSRWGAGVAFRLWSGDDRYHAYRQTFHVKVERQQVIHSDLATSNGWFLKFEGSW